MIKTKRLYYENVYTREFTAQVSECRQTQNGFALLLDQSAFYPEGGGQPCDIGWLDGTEVIDVQEKEGELLHYTKAPIEKGTQVTGRIHWERRFDLMQQHSGEHIVSGLVHEAFGYDNVGFHMGGDVITIDFNGPVTEAQMAEIEKKTNEKIWENRQVEIFYLDEKLHKDLDYRSKKELAGEVRIVRFPGADTCACCGTHVARTGEIGMVKLLSVEKFREGVRMEMISGKRVLDYMNMVCGQNHSISVRLSAKADKTAAAVERLFEECFTLKGKIQRMEEEMFAAEAKKWEGKGDVLLFREGLEADGVRKLADAVMQTCGGRCAVFSQNADGSSKYAMGQKEGNLGQFTKEMNKALNGRGGGRPFFVQGSVMAKKEEIQKFFER